MELPENRTLFSIKQMSEICGISRASLLRLEEDGFLLPYRVNPETGYRYYDMQNVTAVGQYQRMQTIGLSRKEIADLYYERIDSAAFIAELRQTLARLQRFLNEYEMRHDRSKSFSVFYTTLPAVTCLPFRTASENQEKIELSVTEGEFKELCDVRIISETEIILPPNLPKGTRVEIELRLDTSQLVHLWLRIPAVNYETEFKFKRISNLSDQEIEKLTGLIADYDVS